MRCCYKCFHPDLILDELLPQSSEFLSCIYAIRIAHVACDSTLGGLSFLNGVMLWACSHTRRLVLQIERSKCASDPRAKLEFCNPEPTKSWKNSSRASLPIRISCFLLQPCCARFSPVETTLRSHQALEAAIDTCVCITPHHLNSQCKLVEFLGEPALQILWRPFKAQLQTTKARTSCKDAHAESREDGPSKGVNPDCAVLVPLHQYWISAFSVHNELHY